VIVKNNAREVMMKFYELLSLSARKKRFYIRDKFFFEQIWEVLVRAGNASLFTVVYRQEIKAVALVYDGQETRYYAQVGYDPSDKQIRVSAPLMSYMIIDAKRAGLKFFDLYGISADDEITDEKTGFSEFKKSFGGEVVTYAGAWEIPVTLKYYGRKMWRQATGKG
jgi:lipid II:glycine glycyltransferase (peptidoglycan interpeptide bridge formation enzyme)